MKNFVIEALNEKHAKKVVKYLTDLGAINRGYYCGTAHKLNHPGDKDRKSTRLNSSH